MAKNYVNMKDKELKELAEEAGIEFTTRKETMDALKKFDMEKGEGGDVLLVEGDNGLEELEDDGVEYVRVKFHSTRDNDLPYIFMGHNGKSYYAAKDEEIDVPRFLLDSCIKDAVEIIEEPIKVGGGRIEYRTKHVQRFPYTVLTNKGD